MMNDHAEATEPHAIDMTEGAGLDYRAIAVFLWSLLDDIDAAGDQAKSNDVAYRNMAEKLQRRRFEVSTSDGYDIAFTNNPAEPNWQPMKAAPKDGTVILLTNSIMKISGTAPARGLWGEFTTSDGAKVTQWHTEFTEHLVCPDEWSHVSK